MTNEIADTPLVSVIIPCWNRETYVGNAIESVLGQSYRNIEIVVVDDGSTDESARVVAQRYPSVKLLQQQNLGVSAARNTGLRNSTGEFVIFLDSDDWLSNDVVEVHLEAAKHWPDADVYGANTAELNQAGSIIVSEANWPPIPSIPYELLFLHPPLFVGSQMYRRQALIRIGGYDESMKSHEDSDCLLRVVLSGGKIVRSGGGYCAYRRTENSLTRNSLQVHKFAVRFVRKLRKFYCPHDPSLADLVRRRLRGVRLRYWNAYFAFHLSLCGGEPIKFCYHLLKVSSVDPGYVFFVLRDKPWKLVADEAF